jgi:hypothetical protein
LSHFLRKTGSHFSGKCSKRAQPPRRAFGDRTKQLQERTDACVVLDKVERTMDWRIEPLILPLMVATLLLIAAMQAGHG